ncbi:IS256 family transposase [Clostridia bacterium]|nr:IS256 family transposase [Clostridia bacterium]
MKAYVSKNQLDEDEQALVSILARKCRDSGDLHAMLKRLFAGGVEQMLEGEMDEHLGYDKHSPEGRNGGNSRNGYGSKTITSEYGESEISVPRDRQGTFEPQVIAKRQTRTDEIEQKVVAMYSKGMTTRDIEDSLRDIYGAEVSSSLISRITDKILPDINEWQNRPLESVYAVVFFDGIVFNVRQESKVIKKCVYSLLGIGMDGRKELLGFWLSENEGASYYASICADLKKRGVRDILIACHDNLKGLNQAIHATFPECEQQLCIIHQIRASMRFVPEKDRKAVCADLKTIYCAINLDEAEYAKEAFREKWDKKYPSILKSWDANWAELVTFFKWRLAARSGPGSAESRRDSFMYAPEIRSLIYTTNAVEGFHRQLRKFTKTRTIFPTDDAIKKAVYLSVREISRKWTVTLRNWGLIYGQLMIHFEERISCAS